MQPCIYIVMAVYMPDAGYLRQQLASIAAQTHAPHRLVAVIADVQSAALVRAQAAEEGMALSLVEPDTRLDAVRAFEAGIAQALLEIDQAEQADTALIALSDQDDVWHPDRLSRGIARLAESGAELVHSDAALIDGDGKPLHRSVFRFERRHRNPGLRGLLYRNNVTGMTALFRPRLARLALPFPQQSGVHFYHDLWLALLASATGGVALIDAPLVDYRQHGANAIGAVDRGATARRLRLPDNVWLRREAAGYALARFLAQSTDARLQAALRNGSLTPDRVNSAQLRPFLKRLRGGGLIGLDALRLLVTGHPGPARIAVGFAVVTLGRTVWSLRQALGQGLSQAVTTFDDRLWTLAPGNPPERAGAEDELQLQPTPAARHIDQRQTARWSPDFSAEDPALNILVPTLNPTEVFAGIVTALDIGLGLARRGLRVRLIATDLPVFSTAASRAFVLKRLDAAARAAGTEDRITLHCGASNAALPSHRDDAFLATAWWSAHLAQRLIDEHDYSRRRFVYLIQDFEPNFYAWGQEFADAMASYSLDFRPVFNTTLLRDYFADQGFAFAKPNALAFHPAIDIARYAHGQRAVRAGQRRLALYGRPEVARNMFGTAIEALDRFIREEGLGPEQIDPVSVGLRHGPVTLSNGVTLRSQGKLPWDDYPTFLLGCDLGLSLMYSPHPSHPPIEMAASGVRVVTNSFGPKDLSQLTPAILSTDATGPALARALRQAWTLPPVTDKERDISLARLGMAPEDMIEALYADLRTGP